MRFTVLAIEPDDHRLTPELEPDEVVHHAVEVRIDGVEATFDVALHANIGGEGFGLLSPDRGLSARLRLHPGIYHLLTRMVGRVRRGEPVDLPCDLSHMAGVADPSPAASL